MHEHFAANQPGEHHEDVYFGFIPGSVLKFINIVLFIGAIVWAVKGPVMTAFAARTEEIKRQAVEARWEHELAGNADPIAVLNPIAAPLAVMRSSLIGSLVANVRYNLNRKAPRVRVFETGEAQREIEDGRIDRADQEQIDQAGRETPRGGRGLARVTRRLACDGRCRRRVRRRGEGFRVRQGRVEIELEVRLLDARGRRRGRPAACRYSRSPPARSPSAAAWGPAGPSPFPGTRS